MECCVSTIQVLCIRNELDTLHMTNDIAVLCYAVSCRPKPILSPEFPLYCSNELRKCTIMNCLPYKGCYTKDETIHYETAEAILQIPCPLSILPTAPEGELARVQKELAGSKEKAAILIEMHKESKATIEELMMENARLKSQLSATKMQQEIGKTYDVSLNEGCMI